MTSLDIARLRSLAEKAGEGPWFCEHAATTDGLSRVDDGRQHGIFPITAEAHEAEYIAAVDPQTVLALLARVEMLETALRTVADDCAEAAKTPHIDTGERRSWKLISAFARKALAGET